MLVTRVTTTWPSSQMSEVKKEKETIRRHFYDFYYTIILK